MIIPPGGQPHLEPYLAEQVGDWLARRTQSQALLFLLIATMAVAALDLATYRFRLGLGALYIAPIAIACWTLPPRVALAFTVVVAMVSALRYPLLNDDADLWVGINANIGRFISFGINAVIVLGLRRAHDRVTYFASHDQLTGALNKNAFFLRAKQIFGPASGYFLIVYFDLDGFKALNDSKGHLAGDGVLSTFSQTVLSLAEPDWLFGRMGGDEFAVIVPLAHHNVGCLQANELQALCSKNLQQQSHHVTCSAGALVVTAGDTRSATALLDQADSLMYLAKSKGKNCILFASDFDRRQALETPTSLPLERVVLDRAS